MGPVVPTVQSAINNRLSLRDISAELKGLGYVTSKGTPFSAAQVKRFLES
jgi:hypothetical protein